MSFLGTVLGFGGSVASSALQYSQSKKLMDRQYNLAIKGYKESPQAVREGLESAGFNPLNSYASGGNFASSGLGSTSVPDLGQSITNSYKTFSNERKLASATIEKTNAETETQKEITENYRLKNIWQSLENVIHDSNARYADRKNAAQLENFISQSILNRGTADLLKYNAETNRIAANAQKVSSEYGNPIRAIKTEGSKHWQSWKKSHPFLYSIGKKQGISNALDVTFGD